MTLQPDTFKSLVKAAAEQVIASAPELTALDQAIGDGDHGTNMKRGFEAVLSKLDTHRRTAAGRSAQDDRQDAGDDGRRRVRAALWQLLSRGRRSAVARRSCRRILPRSSAAASRR